MKDCDTVLSVQNKKVLSFIKQFIKANKYSPTIREMASGMGFKSGAPVQHHLQVLKNRGFVDWVPRQARTLKIVKQLAEKEDLADD